MILRDSLAYEPAELDFGTSGLRGLVSNMTDLECYINAAGFINFLRQYDGFKSGETLFLAGDLRPSTPRILKVMIKAARDNDIKVVYAGLIPTPALAFYALSKKSPSIMVTGSHIPADRNGIKFNKRGGEVLKPDEAAIKDAVSELRRKIYRSDTSEFNEKGMLKKYPNLPEIDRGAAKSYLKRYVDVFGKDALSGMKLVFYQHSAVGRDLLVDLLLCLGADVITTGRSDRFIPIDSENITPADQRYFKKLAKENKGCFAIVSTDGDSDRPFLVDEAGTFNRGDILGAVAANWLKADSIAVPVSSSDAVDRYFENKVLVVRTKIGSPYVIEAMNEAVESGFKRVVSWEVNGGFLTGSELLINGKKLAALPTRDAIFPIIVALCAARDAGASISGLFGSLPSRYTQAGILDNFPSEISFAILRRYSSDNFLDLKQFFLDHHGFGEIIEANFLDGIRLSFKNGDVAHLRPSGNAPQLRIYSVADSQERADAIVEIAIKEPDGIMRRLENSF